MYSGLKAENNLFYFCLIRFNGAYNQILYFPYARIARLKRFMFSESNCSLYTVTSLLIFKESSVTSLLHWYPAKTMLSNFTPNCNIQVISISRYLVVLRSITYFNIKHYPYILYLIFLPTYNSFKLFKIIVCFSVLHYLHSFYSSELLSVYPHIMDRPTLNVKIMFTFMLNKINDLNVYRIKC